jgi:hypothetical protein
VLPARFVHADLAAAAALAAAHEQRPAPAVQVGFGERQRLVDTQPRAPEHDDQGPKPTPVRAVARGAHDGDDLLDGRRIGRIAEPLVARRAAGVKSRHRRRRATTTGGIERQLGHDPSSGSKTSCEFRAERHGAGVGRALAPERDCCS